MLGTKEKVEAFDRGLDGFVESWVRDKVPDIAADSGISCEECLDFFDMTSTEYKEG